ncbi:MAG TPA: hypothetical protein VHV10_10275, partial [Ktedonobacteraceae bacterium]|nr:hypothetical protein [Ktedonobacteraceae bacterium]
EVMEAELQRATTFAAFSMMTDREASASTTVTDLQTKHAEAKKLFEGTEREIRQADAIAASREAELTASLAQWRLELEATRRDLLAADQAREQALEELGQNKLAEYKQVLKLKYKDPLKTLKRQQIAIESEKQAFLEKAQETFFEGDWYDCYNLLLTESEANDDEDEEE